MAPGGYIRPTVPVFRPETWWECPSCAHQAKTTGSNRLITPMHQCPKLGGLDVPLVQVMSNVGLPRSAVRHRVVEREDYLGDEVGVRQVDGRPVMAVHTERADGSNDVAVFAPTATAND